MRRKNVDMDVGISLSAMSSAIGGSHEELLL